MDKRSERLTAWDLAFLERARLDARRRRARRAIQQGRLPGVLGRPEFKSTTAAARPMTVARPMRGAFAASGPPCSKLPTSRSAGLVELRWQLPPPPHRPAPELAGPVRILGPPGPSSVPAALALLGLVAESRPQEPL